MKNYIKNRNIFFLAVNTGFVIGKIPSFQQQGFYAARSKHGLHCAIVGNVIIPGGFATNNVCAEISNSTAWQQLTEKIAEQGALPGIQLSSVWNGFKGMREFSSNASRDCLFEYKSIGKTISRSAIRKYFDALQNGTELAIKAGFQHIQLHAAHGYLFNLMIDHRLSPNADYGLELIRKWARELAAACIESSLRFSLYSGSAVFDRTGQEQFMSDLITIPVCYLDASAGFYNIDKYLIYPTCDELITARHNATFEFAEKFPTKQIIISGKAARFLDEALPSNIHIGLCRDIIANPDFLRDRLHGCDDCMECHYYSKSKRQLTCGRWGRT